jgi:hypothetical protein
LLLVPVFIRFVQLGEGEASLLTLYRRFSRILGLYLLYGKVTSDAPGVWRPAVRQRFWIITEVDRSSKTILLPSEY